MLKENKWKIIITTLIILIPMLVGCALWNKLPDTIATHFGIDNELNGWSSKAFTVFGLPGVIAVLHLFCLIATSVDPKQKNIGKKSLEIVFWICPAISLIMCTLTYAIALGIRVDVGFVVILFMGLLLIVLGNVMPKAKQNYSFGIKTPWALDDPENWSRSNRLGGWCMVIAGVVIVLTSFLKNPWILVPAFILGAVVPMVYSYVYYKRNHRDV